MRRTHRNDEGGYTLSEVLIAVVILTTAIVAIVGSLGGAIFTSRVHRNLATSDSAVRAYAEQILAGPYQVCAPVTGTGSYAALNPAVPGFTVAVTSVEYGDRFASGTPTDTFSTTLADCTTGGDTGVERITIVGRPTTGPGSQTLQIVKRNPSQS